MSWLVLSCLALPCLCFLLLSGLILACSILVVSWLVLVSCLAVVFGHTAIWFHASCHVRHVLTSRAISDPFGLGLLNASNRSTSASVSAKVG